MKEEARRSAPVSNEAEGSLVGIGQEDPKQALKRRAAVHAATLVQDGMHVGLGTGSTATFLVQALAQRVREGLQFVGVATSEATAELARSLGLKIVSLDDQPELDLAIDGADEVDPLLNLIKGGGGALLREKIVASAARQFAIIVDESKLVERLGTHWAIPVEVVPFGWVRTRSVLEGLGAGPKRREHGGQPFLTDGGHYILDCAFGPIERPADLAYQLKQLTGVVEHGLFIGMATTVVVGRAATIDVLIR